MGSQSQRHEVDAWLEILFDDEQVPEFEQTSHVICQIHQLTQISQLSDKYSQLVVDDMQQKTDEYNAEAQRLKAILSRLNFGVNHMSQLGVNSVRALARLGLALDVRDVSDTSYFLALQGLDDEIEKVQHDQRVEAGKLMMLVEKLQPANLKCKALQKAFDLVKSYDVKEKPKLDKRIESSVFLDSKSRSYMKEVTKLQSQLSQTQVDASLYHETLMKKAEHLQSLQDKLMPLKAELKSYATLPPDLAETKIRIEQEKMKLKCLEDELAECIEVNFT